MSLRLIIAGALLILIWGAAHIFPTRSVVAGFGELSVDNRRIITMEWVAEGMTLMFLGRLAVLVCRDVAAQDAARVVVSLPTLTSHCCRGP